MKTVHKNGILELFFNNKPHEHEGAQKRKKNVYQTKAQENKIKELINFDIAKFEFVSFKPQF